MSNFIPTEHEIQKAIVDALRAKGCVVFETTAYKQKGSSGVDKGIPDLFVQTPGALPGVLIGLEVKRPKAWRWSSIEQQIAWLQGSTLLVTSVGAALSACLGITCLPHNEYRCAAYEMTAEERKKRIAELQVKLAVEKQRKREARKAGRLKK